MSYETEAAYWYIVMNEWRYCAIDLRAMPEGWGALEQVENNYVGRFQCCNQFLMLPSNQLVQHTITCLIYPLEGYMLPLCVSTMPWRCRGDIEVKPCSLELDIDWRFILWLFYPLGQSSCFYSIGDWVGLELMWARQEEEKTSSLPETNSQAVQSLYGLSCRSFIINHWFCWFFICFMFLRSN